MSPLTPLETLVAARRGPTIPLPPELARLYGSLRIPRHSGRPHVIANVVTSLDGVVSLRVPGHASGGDISGHSRHDRLVMGLLRAIADVIVVGAETLRVDYRSIWTAEEIFPDLTGEFRRLRQLRGQPGSPLNVVVSASGRLDLGWRVFASGEVRALIATTAAGARRLQRPRVAPSTTIRALGRGRVIRAGAILAALGRGHGVVLVEGGPRLLGDFVAERALDEQFLTLAPQLAGREGEDGRPGLIAGRTFAPRDPRWGRLVDLRRGGSHLFLRYGFPVSRRRGPRRR